MENGDLRVRNRRHVVKTSPRMTHSSLPEEEKLGFPFSENGPFAIQGEGATSLFSDLREWEERGVTTPTEINTIILKKIAQNLPWTKKLSRWNEVYDSV
jgi:hypothetical protein